MFDIQSPFDILHAVSGKRATVRYPTRDQWEARMKAGRTRRKNIGRGKTVAIPTDPTVHDAKLFEAIKVSGDDLDPAEAHAIVNKLDYSMVQDEPERTGDQFTVRLKVLRANTEHVLRRPTQAELLSFNNGAAAMEITSFGTETRWSLLPAERLYDACFISCKGYVNGTIHPPANVPINHKYSVVLAMTEHFRKLEEDDVEPPEDEDLPEVTAH